jgi:hypothetical protein
MRFTYTREREHGHEDSAGLPDPWVSIDRSEGAGKRRFDGAKSTLRPTLCGGQWWPRAGFEASDLWIPGIREQHPMKSNRQFSPAATMATTFARDANTHSDILDRICGSLRGLDKQDPQELLPCLLTKSAAAFRPNCTRAWSVRDNWLPVSLVGREEHFPSSGQTLSEYTVARPARSSASADPRRERRSLRFSYETEARTINLATARFPGSWRIEAARLSRYRVAGRCASSGADEKP